MSIAQRRHCLELVHRQFLPANTLRLGERRSRADHALWRHHEVDRHIVRCHRNVIVQNLKGVHRGENRRPRVHGSCFAGEREFQIAVTAALAHASAPCVHGYATRNDEIDVPQLLRRDRLAQPCGAFDGRGLSQPSAEARGIEAQKTTLVGKARAGRELTLG